MGGYLFNLNYLRNLDYFFFKSFNFINFGNYNRFLNNFFNNLFSSNNLLHCAYNWHNFFDLNLYFFDFSLNVRNFFYDFLNSGIGDDFLFNFGKFDWLRFDGILNNNFFDDSWNVDNLLNGFMHRDQFLDNSVNWDSNLNGNNDLLLNLDDFWNLDMIVDNLLDWNVSWYFFNYLHNFFLNSFMIDHSFLDSF